MIETPRPLEWKTHYPKDLFLPMQKYVLDEINNYLNDRFGFPLDRLSAHISRMIEDNRKEDVILAVQWQKGMPEN